MASRINQSEAPLTLVIPEGGVSMLDAPGQPFFDMEADQALFNTLEELVEKNEQRKIVRSPHNINDPEFAEVLLDALADVLDMGGAT